MGRGESADYFVAALFLPKTGSAFWHNAQILALLTAGSYQPVSPPWGA
jgi:hypothetical protein